VDSSSEVEGSSSGSRGVNGSSVLVSSVDDGCSEGVRAMVLAFGDGRIANLGDLRGMSVDFL
jgi:hypothetical protein